MKQHHISMLYKTFYIIVFIDIFRKREKKESKEPRHTVFYWFLWIFVAQVHWPTRIKENGRSCKFVQVGLFWSHMITSFLIIDHMIICVCKELNESNNWDSIQRKMNGSNLSHNSRESGNGSVNTSVKTSLKHILNY